MGNFPKYAERFFFIVCEVHIFVHWIGEYISKGSRFRFYDAKKNKNHCKFTRP